MNGQLAARRVAFDVVRQVSSEDAYANLALAKKLATAGLDARDAAFATELVFGTCRLLGTYDCIIQAAAGRKLTTMQPAVVDLLRLLAHQGLSMAVPSRAAVASTVELARATIGQRVTGLVNAVGRKIVAQDLAQWIKQLGIPTHHHPEWIVDAYAEVLPPEELEPALAANNRAPQPTLVIRPGLAEVTELAPAVPTRYSPYGATLDGVPVLVPAVAEGRAGVQDEGSQLVALALARIDAPDGPWLDLCAGPGGKAALLAGLARQAGKRLVANEVAPHRAQLVERALYAYPAGTAQVICSDGRHPDEIARLGPFARIMVDVPCSGLGALRRRPESRWRRTPTDLDDLVSLQRALLDSAISLALPGGVIAYVTCSPHRAETTEIVEHAVAQHEHMEVLDAPSLFPEVPQAAAGRYMQLWPHRHNTDAMFLALLRAR